MVFKFLLLQWLVLIISIFSSIANEGSSECFYNEPEFESGSIIKFPEQTIVRNECNLSRGNESLKELIEIFGTANINTLCKGSFQLKSYLNLTTRKLFKCPTLDGNESLTQEQLINRLTAPCRYDRLKKPETDHIANVYVRTRIYEIKNKVTSAFYFQIRGVMQLRYNDPRLAYGDFVTYKNQHINGFELEKKIWIPKIYVSDQYDSSILESNRNSRLISLSPDGSVKISIRFEATNNCWVDKKTFPLDEKKCCTILKSYKYNSSQLLLYWEQKLPIIFDPKIISPPYVLMNSWSNESILIAHIDDVGYDLSPGNYSSLSFTIHLSREEDLYMMDYFLPSMMIVAISWVSFWLQADQTPARTTLGTSTMLSFITLASSQGKNLPNISSINVQEIWFLGCTFFIFGSLVEFAFVNNIWRRKENVELKKINSKYILKSTLTPNLKSKKIRERNNSIAYKQKYKNILKLKEPTVICVSDEVKNKQDIESKCIPKKNLEDIKILSENSSFSKMTPHDISLWIDRKARFIFPLAFIIFNGIFWTFLYCS